MNAVSFCSYSCTIRQFPQNYLMAYKRNGAWIMEPDLAADKTLVVALTLSLMEHKNKYGSACDALLGMAPHLPSVC